MVVLRPSARGHAPFAHRVQHTAGLDVLVEDFAFEGKVKARHPPLVAYVPSGGRAGHAHGHHKWKGINITFCALQGYDGTTRAGPAGRPKRRVSRKHAINSNDTSRRKSQSQLRHVYAAL